MRRLRCGLVFCAMLWLMACAGTTNPAAGRIEAPLLDRPATLAAHPTALDPEAAINRIISKMTLDQKVGQLLMLELFLPDGYSSYINAYLTSVHAGGVILYNLDTSNNWAPHPTTIAGMRALNDAIQQHADIPMLIAMDQEGGYVDRLFPYYPDDYFPEAAQIAATGNPQNARKQGSTDAQKFEELGINVNLAPIVDVGSLTTSFGRTRNWSDQLDVTDEFAGAYLDGLQQTGIAGTLKHWPGIGQLAILQDPHSVLPTMNRTLDQFKAVDFSAFKNLFSHGPGLIMVTHVIDPAIDPTYPTSLSPIFINQILRGQLGYQGVVITDSLHMGGIYQYMCNNLHQPCANSYQIVSTMGEAGVLAVLAGDDVLEGAFDIGTAQIMANALKAAVKSGRIPLSRIEESDRRILRLKWAYGIGLDRLIQMAGPGPLPATSVAPTGIPTPTAPVAVTTADLPHS